MKSKFFTLGLLAGAFMLCADEAVPKTPGVCFRFDDNKPVEYWQGMNDVFEKHGCKFSLAITSQSLNQAQKEKLKSFIGKGHTFMDHTPNHAMFKIAARSQKEFEEYSKLPFVDHADPKSKWIYFKYELNKKHPKNKKFQGEIKNGELVGYPANMKGQLGFTRKILIPETGKVYGIAIVNGKKILRSFWGETVTISDTKGEFIFLAVDAAIQPTDDGLRFMAETSKKNFLAAGLPAPKVWIQPGGWECFVNYHKISKIYGKEFGYVSADCIPGSSRNLNGSFNDPDLIRGRYTMCPDFTGPDNGQDFAAMKRNIADCIAKNRVKIFISHMSINRVKGGWDAYIKGYDELLTWLKANNIPVKTQEIRPSKVSISGIV